MGRVRSTLYFSDEAQCLTTVSVGIIKNYPAFSCDIELNGKPWAHLQVCEVEMFGKKYWADKVTGSLYDIETLRCLSGSLRISSEIVAVRTGKKVEVAHV